MHGPRRRWCMALRISGFLNFAQRPDNGQNPKIQKFRMHSDSSVECCIGYVTTGSMTSFVVVGSDPVPCVCSTGILYGQGSRPDQVMFHLWQVISHYFRFPCQAFCRLPHPHSSSGTGQIGRRVASRTNGASLTPTHETKLQTPWPEFASELY
jgi:hypothetical protein